MAFDAYRHNSEKNVSVTVSCQGKR